MVRSVVGDAGGRSGLPRLRSGGAATAEECQVVSNFGSCTYCTYPGMTQYINQQYIILSLSTFYVSANTRCHPSSHPSTSDLPRSIPTIYEAVHHKIIWFMEYITKRNRERLMSPTKMVEKREVYHINTNT
jgi:hypothetical protein